MDINEKIRELGLTIPEAAKPLASYVPVLIADRYAYVSGQLPVVGGQLLNKGRLGEEVTVEQAALCARQCALNILGALKGAIGDLANIDRLIKLTGFVACPAHFIDQPKVINGASDLFVELMGERGRHARAAVGVSSLPLGAPVEIEAIFALK